MLKKQSHNGKNKLYLHLFSNIFQILIHLRRLFALSTGLCTPSSCVTKEYVIEEGLKMNWTEAQSYCKDKYTDLATIENEEDIDVVLIVMKDSREISERVWIGLNDMLWSWNWSLEDKHFFTNGSDQFRNWGTGEPDFKKAKETCTMMGHNDGLWADVSCTDNNYVVCFNGEISLSHSHTSTDIPFPGCAMAH